VVPPTLLDQVSEADVQAWLQGDNGPVPEPIRQLLAQEGSGSLRHFNYLTTCDWLENSRQGFAGCISAMSVPDLRSTDEILADLLMSVVPTLQPMVRWSEDLCKEAAQEHGGGCFVLTCEHVPSPLRSCRIESHKVSVEVLDPAHTTAAAALLRMLARILSEVPTSATTASTSTLIPVRIKAGGASTADTLAPASIDFWLRHPHLSMTSFAAEFDAPKRTAVEKRTKTHHHWIGAALFGPQYDAALNAAPDLGGVGPEAEQAPSFTTKVRDAGMLGCTKSATVNMRRGAWAADIGPMVAPTADRSLWHERDKVGVNCAPPTRMVRTAMREIDEHDTSANKRPGGGNPFLEPNVQGGKRVEGLSLGADNVQCRMPQPELGGLVQRKRHLAELQKYDTRPRASNVADARVVVLSSDMHAVRDAHEQVALALASGAAPVVLVKDETSVSLHAVTSVGVPVAFAGGLMRPWVHYIPLDMKQLQARGRAPGDRRSLVSAILADQPLRFADEALERTARNARYLLATVIQPEFRRAYHGFLLQAFTAAQ
jgi:hypothetical protein